MDRQFPYYLGATLYMPVIHPHAGAIMRGERPAPATSVVLCLEDALAAPDVKRGFAALRDMLKADIGIEAKWFVRPRSFKMAQEILELPGIRQADGFVAPKLTERNAKQWLRLTEYKAADGFRLMPTLESADYFEPARVAAVRDILLRYADRIACVRIGGNDLLNCMALRRVPGITAYEGPLSWVLGLNASIMMAAGIPVAAPVFDVIDDLETLRREAAMDAEMGFVSKTAVHPAQVKIIEAAFRVKHVELEQAALISSDGAAAVFKSNGAMCEPSTHRNWAARVFARSAAHRG